MVKLEATGSMVQVKCGGCGAENRFPVGRLADGPRCGRCQTGLTVGEPLAATDESLAGVVRAAKVPVLVDFWAPWCGPCRTVAPEVAEVARQLAGRALVLKVNSDEAQRAASQYAIRSIPALLVFRGGQEANRAVGAMPAAQIMALLG